MIATDEDDEATALWKGTMEQLLSKGASPAEAIDGANLILQAYKRHLEEIATRRDSSGSMSRSGVRRRVVR